MALNTVVYFPNPSSSNSKTIGVSVSNSIGSNTLETVTAGRAMRIKNGYVSILGLGGGATDCVVLILKIGSAYVKVPLNLVSTTVVSSINKTAEELGIVGLWLRDGETITAQLVNQSGTAGATAVRYSVSLGVDDYMA